MEYHDRLRELREDRDLTLAEIAAMLGTSYQYYQKYEKGKHPLPITHLRTLCEYYGVSADYILGLPEGLAWPRPGRKAGYYQSSRD